MHVTIPAHLLEDPNALLTGDELAEVFRLSDNPTARTRQLQRLRARGLPYVRFGPRTLRYPAAAVRDWIEQRTHGGDAA